MDFKNYNYERSLIDDFINNKKTKNRSNIIKLILSIIFTLFLLCISFAISIGFFYLKNYFVNTVFKNNTDNNIINFKHNTVNAIETIKIILFDHFYYYIAVNLASWIDPKYTYEFETILIEEALNKTGGRRQDAAKLLGWGRNTLTRKIKQLDLDL